MAKQAVYRSGFRSNATARRLIAASMQMAPSVERATVVRNDIKQPVIRCLAMQDTVQAGVHIYAGQHFYLVASAKFPGRFFVLVHHWTKKGVADWKCSSSDEIVRVRCVRQVEAYRKQLQQKQAA